MAPRSHVFIICVLSLFALAASADPTFPTMKEITPENYQTEVQVTDIFKQDTAYATEYFDISSDSGRLDIVAAGERRSVYFNNKTFEIFEVNGTYCEVMPVDISNYDYYGAFYGWLNKNPLVIGPSAALHYAQTREVKYAGKETVRDIPCDKFTLTIKEDGDYVTLDFYFAPAGWTTSYQYDGQRTPIRIHAVGNSSKETESKDEVELIDIYTDFVYFKRSIDFNDLQPPVGLGCSGRKKTNVFPKFKTTFQYSAEVVDLLYETEHIDVDVRFERVWYDADNKIGRFDIYKKTTSSSSFQAFNLGVMYEFTKERKCSVLPLKNAFLEKYEVDMLGEMKEPAEVLNLDGEFYEMGKKEIRGVLCDVFESVKTNFFYKEQLQRFVVTAYISEDYMKVGVDGIDEQRIPISVVLTGWRNGTQKAFELQYNIFSFNDNIWPEMYSNFGMEDCHIKAESKAYFILMLQTTEENIKKMEAQDYFVVKQLRSELVKYAVVPDWRIPFLKVDYKPMGVFATGMMIERPPTLMQFYQFSQGQQKAWEKEFATVADTYTLEACADACIDFDEPCKGFYFCNSACLIKLTDPSDEHSPDDKEIMLGRCDEYLRAARFTTNSKNIPLKQSLEKLETAVLNQTIDVVFRIPHGEGDIKVIDVVIGEGPYSGVDAADKPYKINDAFRKLDPGAITSTPVKDVEMLNDCYRKCKAAGSQCSTFSFCGRSTKKDKQCILSSELVVRGKTNDLDLIASSDCDIYDLNYLQFFTKYPEHVSFLSGYKVNRDVNSVEECAKQCRLEDKGKCRGFEYCRSMKSCSMHTKHVLDLKPGEKGDVTDYPCVHYAARFTADYDNLGMTLLDDKSNVRYSISLEECARVCSEELGDSCRSFNYCPSGRGSCELSRKMLTDPDVTTTQLNECQHYEKRKGVEDWTNTKAKDLSKTGWTSKGFTGLVFGMLALGLIIGALGFVGYSYFRSRRQGEGMSVRFMKQET